MTTTATKKTKMEKKKMTSSAPRRRQKKTRPNKTRKRTEPAATAAVKTKAQADAGANAQGLSAAAPPLVTVNVAGAAVDDPPCPLPGAREAFSPELDNPLLRSLLYDRKHTHVLALAENPVTENKPKARRAAAEGGGGAAPTTGTPPARARDHQNNGGTDADADASGRRRTKTRASVKVEEAAAEALGALTAHLVLSPRASKRPKLDAHGDGDARRPGAPSAGERGPGPAGPGGRVADGTAGSVDTAPLAAGPSRAGLAAAATVEAGLVPTKVKVEARCSETLEGERARRKEAESGATATATAPEVEGAAAKGGGSSAPLNLEGGAPTNGDSSPPADSRRRNQALRGRGDTVALADWGGDGSGNSEPLSARAQDDAPSPASGGGASAGCRDLPSIEGGRADDMDVEDDLSDQARGASDSERGGQSDGSGGTGSGLVHARRGTHVRRGTCFIGGLDGIACTSGSGGGGSSGRPRENGGGKRPAEKVHILHPAGGKGGEAAAPPLAKQDTEKKKRNDPLRKANRMWNLRHARATTRDGKADVCSHCCSRPDGGVMVCCSKKLAKFHRFCFPCLRREDGVEKSELFAGGTKVCVLVKPCAGIGWMAGRVETETIGASSWTSFCTRQRH